MTTRHKGPAMFETLSTTDFLQNYWQRCYYFEAGACKELSGLITGDELAGLACEEESVSRIVAGKAHHGQWSSRYGPFTTKEFEQLPSSDWSLLVESVDRYDPQIKRVFDKFSFLPHWRRDDIMISYAAPGGGVGPHFDYYDVFLIQIEGTREWQLGQFCNEESALLPNQDIKLLQQFDTAARLDARAGDILYVPAGLAHWGTATTENCVTLSVGFRAPSRGDVLTAAMDIYVQNIPANQRYSDCVDSLEENSYQINAGAVQQLKTLAGECDADYWESCLRRAFGQLVTEGGDADADLCQFTMDQLANILKNKHSIQTELAEHSRFAFDQDLLFVNGQTIEVESNFSQMLLSGRLQLPLSTDGLNVLLQLFQSGSVLLIDA